MPMMVVTRAPIAVMSMLPVVSMTEVQTAMQSMAPVLEPLS